MYYMKLFPWEVIEWNEQLTENYFCFDPIFVLKKTNNE